MKTKGTIILIEEDQDDIQVISSILTDISPEHKLLIFFTLEKAFKFLAGSKEKPFLIICDNNWHKKSSQQLQLLFNSFPAERMTRIPFVFYSANINAATVNDSYNHLNVQGYFKKATDRKNMEKDMAAIIDYWERSIQPEVSPET